MGVALAIPGAGIPLMLAAVLFAVDPPMTPLALLESFAIFVVLPLTAAGLAWRALAADAWIEGDRLVIDRSGGRSEVPLASIARLKPWRLPLPAPGFVLWMRSGRRFPSALATEDPSVLLQALAAAGVEGAQAAAAGTLASWARERARTRRGWTWLTVKFPIFALLPTAAAFSAHQHIAFGGLFGQYYLYGLEPYLRSFALFWATSTIYLLLFASALRAPAEALTLLAARVAPPRAAGVRRTVERACQWLYFGAVPAVLALRFLA
jgi:hypothetical protein